MRWKLLIAASLLAAAAGAGACYAAARLLLPPWGSNAPGWAATLTLLAPLAAVASASIFVYRHTARRRALQAAATALLSLLLALAALTLGSLIPVRPEPEMDVPPPAKIS